MSRLRRNIFVVALCGGAVFVALAGWLASGTMAPYAVTLDRPLILKPCNYLLNIDHANFHATFLMLDGARSKEWAFSVVLRRTLYPVLAYPFMKAFGFMAGGVIASLLMQVAAFVAFALFVRRRVGRAAALAAIVLLATYPGIYYWAGLPYSYAAIVPASLGAIIVLGEIEHSTAARRVAWLSLLLGVLVLAYDLLPFFAPAAVLIVLLRRQLGLALASGGLIVLPTIVNNAVLTWVFEAPLYNKNTKIYVDIFRAYTDPQNLDQWGGLLRRVPEDLLRTYFASNFIFLPALFLLLLVINRFAPRLRLMSAEKWVLAATGAMFLFINLAPPTPGWTIRGHWAARIYQPVFVVMMLFAVRMFQEAWRTRPRLRGWMVGLVALTVVPNAAVALGPALRIRLADHVYHAFYLHADRPMISANLELFGRRPLGFCDESITIENRGPKKKRKPPRRKPRAAATVPATSPATTSPAATSPAATSPATRPASGPSAPPAASAPAPGG